MSAQNLPSRLVASLYRAMPSRRVPLQSALLLVLAAASPLASAQYTGSLNLTLPIGFLAGSPANLIAPPSRLIGVTERDAQDQLGFAVGFRLSNRVSLVGQASEATRYRGLFDGAAVPQKLAYGLDVVGALPLFDKFSLVGNAGVARERRDAFHTAYALDPFSSTSRSAASGRVGLGLRYDINAGLGFRIGIERKRVFGGALNGADIDSDSISIGARLRF